MYDFKSIANNSFNKAIIKGLILKKFYFDKIDNPEILIVNGFWRSGTTFLQEIIQKTFHTEFIFEPLNEVVPISKKLFDQKGVRDDKLFRKISMYDLNFKSNTDKNWINQIKSHFGYNKWTKSLYKRKHIGTYNNRKIVVKFVNAHFFIKDLTNMDYKTIHLKRDLIETISSFKKTKWTSFFEKLNLFESLPENFFKKYPTEFNALITYVNSEENYLIKVALYKLITDFWVNEENLNILHIKYEDVMTNFESVIKDISAFTGWSIRDEDFEKIKKTPSRMSQKYAISQDGIYNKSKVKLDKNEIDKIRELNAEFSKTVSQIKR